MANKPSVTLTMVGDEKRLTESFDKVGRASKQMADDVGSAGKDIRSHAKHFDELGEKTDETERRSMGFKDVLDGVSSGIQTMGDSSLSTTDKLIGFGQAGADLAGGLTNFLIPTISNLVTFMRGPLAAAMTFVSSHPLLLVIGLLAAAFVLLWTQSDKFREIVINAFTVAGRFAREVFGVAIDWIVDRWNGLVDWFSKLPSRILGFFGAIGDGIIGAFKTAFNFVADIWNNTIGRINFDIPSWVPVIGGNHFGVPHIPKFHTGGVFHASGGGEGLAVLRDGERVSAPGQGASGGSGFQISVPLVEQIQAWFNDGTLVLVGR